MTIKILIITSSGGGGHLSSAAKQKEYYMSQGYLLDEIATIDIMGQEESANNQQEAWIPSYGWGSLSFSGQKNVKRWNEAQKMGGIKGVRMLEQLVSYQHVAEMIQASTFLKKTKKFLKEHPDIEMVIDTQALSTPELCRAVTEVNHENSQRDPIQVKKIISEFITSKADHYFDSLSRVRSEHSDCLTVSIVGKPLKLLSESNNNFYTRKKVSHINFESMEHPVSDEFSADYKGNIYIKIPGDAQFDPQKTERDYLYNTLNINTTITSTPLVKQQNTHCKIEKTNNDFVITICLGSQSSSSIIQYIDTFIDQVLAGKLPKDKNIRLFIAAGKNTGHNDTIYAKARLHLKKREAELKAAKTPLPESAKIIILSFQDSKSISSLFQNSDILITKTGGMSSAEVDKTKSDARQVYINSEEEITIPDIFPVSHFDAIYHALLSGTVLWEGGNAQYLMTNHRQAALTCPSAISFNPDNFPNYQESLLAMSTRGEINEEHIKTIEDYIKRGSSPNLEAIDGLPILFHAQDFKTIELLIKYGGKVTKELKKHLIELKIADANQLKTLQQLEENVQRSLFYNGYTDKIKHIFLDALSSGNILYIKGLLYLYPKLAFIKPQEIRYPADENITKEVQYILNRAKGIPALSLKLADHTDNRPLRKLAADSTCFVDSMLESTKQVESTVEFPKRSNEIPQLKRLIYSSQEKLNQVDNQHKTPLTYCKNIKLCEFMVKMGANPNYLASDIPISDKKKLKKNYNEYQKYEKQLRQAILQAYTNNRTDEAGFYQSLNDLLNTRNIKIIIDDDVKQYVFAELSRAQDIINLMSIISRIINFIKYFFNNDVLSRQSYSEAKAILFYTADTESTDLEPTLCPMLVN